MQTETRVRHSAEERKNIILNSALALSEQKGFNNFSSLDLAEVCGCNHSLIFHYFGNMEKLREDIMQKAVNDKNLVVIGQGLVDKYPAAINAPENLKQKALNTFRKI
jgi:AcrR family transcriptional regulator